MNRLAERLDPRLDEIPHFHELTEAETVALEVLDAELKDLENNMTLSNTTETQINRREAEFGVISDLSKTIEQRRAVLIAKLRGQGTTTPAAVLNIAASFDFGEISIDESSTPYTVRIVFEEFRGIPPNMADFIAALEEIKPAHLVFEYVYKYNTWGDYKGFHKTIGEWEEMGMTWGWIKTYQPEDGTTESYNQLQQLAAQVAGTIRKAVNRVNGLHI